MDGPVLEDMWTPYKRLYDICQMAIRNPTEVTGEFELSLKKYKQNFTNFLRNPPKSEKSRTHLRNAMLEGVMLAGQTRKVEISQDIIDEAIIISDMFDLDEIFALELLCTAQRQQVHHPGLPRGLVAVLLYYDGRKAITCTLRDMFQAISGVSWSTELPREMTALINNYCQNLVEDSNILGRLLELLIEMDIEKEINLLTKNRAFGSKRHQNQVLGLYQDIRKALSMALFNWSAQRGLPKNIAIRLLQHLANTKSADPDGNLEDVTLIMLMALMYAYDTSVLLLTECNSPHTAKLPILSDPEYAKCFIDAIYAQSTWHTQYLSVLIKYSFGLTLASLRQAPSEYQSIVGAFINRDEQLIDEALAANVFTYIYHHLLNKDVVYSTEFIYRRLHLLITDFIDFMHAKVSELRGRADETARTVISFQNEGLEPPPNLDCSFELLMLCVARLYGDKRVTIILCNEYWGPTDASTPNSGNYVQNTSRAVSLFKFIRLASELLPQTLFRSYLKMIAGLTRTEFAARCAFNLLKNSQNLSSTYAVSWDHFFYALNNYFNNMRTDYDTISPDSGSIYRKGIPRNMTPREAEHMAAVMGVMQAVADRDEISRIMLCDNANWQTPQVLLGLVACATPVNLKGEILFTLAALSRSKETARNIWFHLEESQIIPTIPTVTTTYPVFSLAEEINQNESRLEEYKLTRGILQLLYNLMTTNMPKSLGCGPRQPGYDPYLKFVIDSIMLKFYNRAYKDITEKWAVGASCLKLLYFLLASYRPKASDFLEERDEHPYPGYHVMLQLQVKSDMLRLVLLLVEEARERLDDFNQFNGKELLEDCALYALLMLECALSKQNAFFEAHATSNSSILLLGLNRMLLDLNPRTRSPDYVLNIIKFVSFNSWLPRHTLAAIKILSAVCLLPNVATQILNMYAHGSNEKLEIRQRFVECLEMQRIQQTYDDEQEQGKSNDLYKYGNNGSLNESGMQVDLDALDLRKPARIELQIKEAIIHLFETNLSQPMPNFIYFLLGIDVLRDFLGNENQQQLGLEVNCSCINSMVLLLERHLEQQRKNDEYCEHTAHIVERVYHLFHGLCANRRTSEAILRYFRLTCNDFLLRHLTAMPFRYFSEDNVLHAMSHVMNCVSIEMKLAATNGQTTRYALLSDILLAVNSETQRNGHNMPVEIGNNLLTPPVPNHFSDIIPSRVMLHTASLGLHANRLLDCIKLETQTLNQPKLEFFDERLLSNLLTDCEAGKGSKVNAAGMINIHKLHDILHDELRHVQSTIVSGQRKAIVEEITIILQYAIKLNGVRMQRFATYNYMSGWCNLIQVLFSLMPNTVLPISLRKQHIIDIIEKIMLKVEPQQPLIKISVQVTDTILLLSANLRHCYNQLEDQRSIDEHGNICHLTDVSGAVDANGNGNNNQSGGKNNLTLCHVQSNLLSSNSCSSSNLRFILKRLIDWIMTCEVKSQKLSINLYATLLNCLRIVKRVRTEAQVEYDETFLDGKENTDDFDDDGPYQKELAAEIISSMGDKLIDTICHDAITGHDVCSMLALSCLDLISELRAFSTLSETIARRGYLKHLLSSLAKSDESLHDVLKPEPDNMRPLFVYESYMAFLTQMAETYLGATLLLNDGTLGVLANMTVFDMQPDLQSTEIERNSPGNFIPPVDERFRSILMPALALCDSIIDTLGVSNNSASLQVLNFLFAHIEMIEGLLRAASPFMQLGNLKLLAKITNLFARTTTYDVSAIEKCLKIHHDVEMNNRLSRLQQLMIVVFGRFTINEETMDRMVEPEHSDDPEIAEEQKTQHIKYFLDITANLSLFCRHAVTSHVRDGITSKYLITTMISDVTPLSGKSDCKKLTAVMQTIMNQLKGSIAYFLSQKSIADNLVQQRASLPNMTFGPTGKQNYLELSQRHTEKSNELMLAVFIAEQNLYLLWIHLDFYFRNAVIYSRENRTSINETCLDPNNMSVLNASHDEIQELKQMLIYNLNETFCTQLITASEEYSMKCKNFNTALLRRIKSLVQFAPVA
ncbi:hypothetical protein AWZ03_012989 [Drosophila navojoa]|uniref:Nuclear pore complex protein Nup205 n=1 Tax=Drosophila navojoa TaxID=7232 RepID=A0A484AX64_DRONA|nr:nuclear pore complex protein Nup205 [Drosophila navojoa]TDG40592.1 hypothetical protein AWZ03_012989 [Drosophila navojoa]